MQHAATPVLESRLSWGIYFVPILLAGGAVAILVAWIVLGLVGMGAAELALIGSVMAIIGVIDLALAGVWVWGARRARLTIADDRLSIVPHLGRRQSVTLTRLASVDLHRLPASGARAFTLVDADGNSVQIGVAAWQREAEILKLIGAAARRSGAEVTSDARDAVS